MAVLRKHFTHAAVLGTAMCLMAEAFAVPTLRCLVTQAGETQTIDTAPAPAPYGFRSHDIRGHFRFKPVMVGNAAGIEYVKLYTYYQSPEQPMLMHVAKYAHPRLPRGDEAIPLTGVMQLVSPRLGRELEYACSLIEAGP